MIRHVLTFRFRPEVSAEEQRSLLEELSTFPSRFPAMRNWTMGRNISKRDDTFDWAFVVDFDSEADLVAYLNSEAHERFVTERWKPVIASRAITSFEAKPDI